MGQGTYFPCKHKRTQNLTLSSIPHNYNHLCYTIFIMATMTQIEIETFANINLVKCTFLDKCVC